MFHRPRLSALLLTAASSLAPGLVFAASAPVPATGSIHLEAEDGALHGVELATVEPGFTGVGYVAGFHEADDSITWTFTAPAGSYRLLIRHRTEAGSGKGFAGSLNDTAFSGHFPGSHDFTVQRGDLLLTTEGQNVLRLGGGWNHYEIDSVALIPEAPPPPPAPVPLVLSDPRASVSALRLLATLAANYGKTTYSGQQETGDFAYIAATSGRTPAILSGDLLDYTPSRREHGSEPGDYSERLIAKAREGHILSLCWHWNAPADLLNNAKRPWWAGFYTNASTFDFAAALADPAGAHHALLLRDIDALAVELKKFQDADIPVLWRPLHESEGGWFWWGAKGPEPFKKLWRLVFDRLTDHHELHNLVWVLTSEDPAWYPGDDVVDILGVDAYPPGQSDPLVMRWEALRDRFDGKKIIALTEFGGVPDIEKMQARGVWWSYFASWTGENHGPRISPAEQVARIYRSSTVLTLDELPAATPAAEIAQTAPAVAPSGLETPAAVRLVDNTPAP